jgi:hypothetical protein
MDHPSEYCECPNCVANRLAAHRHGIACRDARRAAGFVPLPEDEALEGKPNQFITIGHLAKSTMHHIRWLKANPDYQAPPDTHKSLPCLGWWADQSRR